MLFKFAYRKGTAHIRRAGGNTARAIQIMRLFVVFYVQAKYSKSNINDRHRALAIGGNPGACDFAIVRKTPVYFGINLMGAQTREGAYIVNPDD